MLRLVVLSDSHGRETELEMILQKERSADGFIYLGDGVRDVLFPSPYTSGKPVYSVKSRTDLGAMDRPYELVLRLEGVTLYLCHGDALPTDVKLGFGALITKGIYNGAALCCFGHTHRQTLLETEGLTLFNPGAVRDGRYGILELDGGRFRCFHRDLYKKEAAGDV